VRIVLLSIACVLTLNAQGDKKEDTENPLAGKPEAVEAGKKLFGAACSACHGKTGEGGRGPNLADGEQVRRLNNRQLFDSIKSGVRGTDMPAFPLPEEQIWQLVTFVRSLSAPAYESRVPGDPGQGSEIFFGKGGCVDCHMIHGRGGFLGPDLSHAGMRRSWKQLQEDVLAPSARLSQGFQAVDVIAKTGEKISGVAKDNTNYSIHILDRNGGLHLMLKKDLREVTFHQNSLMPGDYGQRLNAEEVDNLLAFLSRQAVRTNAVASGKKK
jgi:putative heme-binding domain-containing protein